MHKEPILIRLIKWDKGMLIFLKWMKIKTLNMDFLQELERDHHQIQMMNVKENGHANQNSTDTIRLKILPIILKEKVVYIEII
jgi:hypothetical protein